MIYIAITSKRYEIGCQLVLITNRKSHTGFRLVPISVILNDQLNCLIALILRYFTELSLEADYVMHIIIIMWLVQSWTLPFVRACSMPVDSALGGRRLLAQC